MGDLLDARQSREQPELLELVGHPVERLDQGLLILGRSARPSGGILVSALGLGAQLRLIVGFRAVVARIFTISWTRDLLVSSHMSIFFMLKFF